jgi:hypothetical protein
MQLIDQFTFVPVYTGLRGKRRICGIKRSPAVEKAGCYIIKWDGVIVYIGFSSTNAHRVLYRHFQRWTDIRWIGYGNYIRLNSYSAVTEEEWSMYEVSLVNCADGRIAQLMEKQLICGLNPRDNVLKYTHYILPEEEEAVA